MVLRDYIHSRFFWYESDLTLKIQTIFSYWEIVISHRSPQAQVRVRSPVLWLYYCTVQIHQSFDSKSIEYNLSNKLLYSVCEIDVFRCNFVVSPLQSVFFAPTKLCAPSVHQIEFRPNFVWKKYYNCWYVYQIDTWHSIVNVSFITCCIYSSCLIWTVQTTIVLENLKSFHVTWK